MNEIKTFKVASEKGFLLNDEVLPHESTFKGSTGDPRIATGLHFKTIVVVDDPEPDGTDSPPP